MVEYVVYLYKSILNNGTQSFKLVENSRYSTFEEAEKSLVGKKSRYCIAKEVTTVVNEKVDNSRMRLNVFRMNDIEWWCTHMDLKEFYTWYLKEHGLDPEDNPLDEVSECDLDKQGMWWIYEDSINQKRLAKAYEKQGDIEKHHKGYKTCIGQVRDCYNGKYAEMIPFRKAIDLYGLYTGPFCIAATE